jgi:hypothetical protein
MTIPGSFDGFLPNAMGAALPLDAGAIAQWAAQNGIQATSISNTPNRSPEQKNALFDPQFAVLPPLVRLH